MAVCLFGCFTCGIRRGSDDSLNILQSSNSTRAKMSMMNSMSRMRGQEKGPGYTQTETILGESMQRFGRELGEDSTFGMALIDAGEAMRELGEVKDALDMEIEQVSQLAALVHAQVQYHTRSAEILTQLSSKIDERIREISNKPRKDFMPKPRTSLDFSISENYNGGIHGARSPAPLDQPCCRALYDFDPENEGELGFKEGDIITLTNKIDDNWYEGMLHGNSGFFPINYVDILVPLPQ
ncbi:hypothetical protein GOODEAATRI_014651 [Goodea atripinnis]|uniref:SH3 domain-containing protein n=1 Tax=Goodea atripinnis TaxID=208336 RepID=A0ABV0PNP8_9TELE